jgi:transposase
LVEREDVQTKRVVQQRIEHQRGTIRGYLRNCEPGTPVAVEATGNWYWIIDEIEQAGLAPRLVHPRKAKLMMGMINKTDKLDVHGLNVLQRNRTLPTVWIPPGEIRDLRELTRGRMVLTRQATRLKNRIQATLAKYGLGVRQSTDAFGKGGRKEMTSLVPQLPAHTRWMTDLQLEVLDTLTPRIERIEARLKQLLKRTPPMQRLESLPGVGTILAAVIAFEMGDVRRFAGAERFASYAGTTPRVHSSGDKTRYGQLRRDVNHYLKWAFIEAANCVALHHKTHEERHVSKLYASLRQRKGHSKAIGAVARHLAEAAYHVSRRDRIYRDPSLGQRRGRRARPPHEPTCIGSGSECDTPSEYIHAPHEGEEMIG